MDKIEDSNIPEYMWDGIKRYIEKGIAPGSFLLAILENDFVGAALRADTQNQYKFKEYAYFLRYGMPSQAWGSPKKVQSWIQIGGLSAEKIGL